MSKGKIEYITAIREGASVEEAKQRAWDAYIQHLQELDEEPELTEYLEDSDVDAEEIVAELEESMGDSEGDSE
ncbi:hypothetical protein [Halobacterium noricense]|uniref:hypothetical protein n=1 Tax=Halobacterium noricense TaxID=223182 RepID=UPI001E42D8AC|nr:hypothetical protein [Halobacterium noricense]UHH25611.1 hypothetical protein LT974_01405 [Halobacterium noricense]